MNGSVENDKRMNRGTSERDGVVVVASRKFPSFYKSVSYTLKKRKKEKNRIVLLYKYAVQLVYIDHASSLLVTVRSTHAAQSRSRSQSQ